MTTKLGQNFLVDESVLRFEAEAAGVRGRGVLEIGAGDGRLTSKLLSAGAGHVTAVEIDPKLAKALRQRFRSRVKVVGQDFLKFDESRRFNCVVGNIPYYITSQVIMKLARMEFGRAVLCVQKEVAERMAAQPGSGEYGRLSVASQLLFSVGLLASVPAEAFSPKPKVDSCIISLERTGLGLAGKEEGAIGALFSHRKKSVRNAVVDARVSLFGSGDRKAAAAAAQNLKYAQRKVFTLTPHEALEVARQLAVMR
jgi:ribosomal RNA small subunit methyltransferase A